MLASGFVFPIDRNKIVTKFRRECKTVIVQGRIVLLVAPVRVVPTGLSVDRFASSLPPVGLCFSPNRGSGMLKWSVRLLTRRKETFAPTRGSKLLLPWRKWNALGRGWSIDGIIRSHSWSQFWGLRRWWNGAHDGDGSSHLLLILVSSIQKKKERGRHARVTFGWGGARALLYRHAHFGRVPWGWCWKSSCSIEEERSRSSGGGEGVRSRLQMCQSSSFLRESVRKLVERKTAVESFSAFFGFPLF